MSAEPTGQKRGVRIALTLTLAALLALPAAAQAESFRGKTSQRRMASLVVGDDGFVTRIRISYSAPCTDPRYRFPNVLRIEPPFDAATKATVTEKVVLRDRLEGGGHSRQTATITAERSVDADGVVSWSGRFKTRAVLTKNGKRLDVCALKRVTWSATAVSLPETPEPTETPETPEAPETPPEGRR
jgi:hypothetical protein